MKIAYIVSQFPTTTQTFIQNQILGMLVAGLEVSIFAVKAGDDRQIPEELNKCTNYSLIPQNPILRYAKGIYYLFTYFLKYPVPILRSLNVFRYGRPAATLSLLYQIVPFLGKGPYDVIHCQFGTYGLRGLYIKEVVAETAKVVTSFRGFDATKSVQKHLGLYKKLFKEGDLFLPVSHSLKHLIIQQGCDESKIVVLPSGIDCQKFPYSSKALREGEPVRVITIARLVEKKGIAYAIQAVDKVVQSGRVVQYSIIGDGELRGELARMIEERNLKEHVQLLGWKSHQEVMRVMRNAHILIAPSVTAADGDQEGIPNAIKEAMALGLPVIATRHSGIPEIVEDGVSGFLVEEKKSEALADKLAYLVDHPERWADMGRAGRARVETDYDIKTLNDRLVVLYEQLLKER